MSNVYSNNNHCKRSVCEMYKTCERKRINIFSSKANFKFMLLTYLSPKHSVVKPCLTLFDRCLTAETHYLQVLVDTLYCFAVITF